MKRTLTAAAAAVTLLGSVGAAPVLAQSDQGSSMAQENSNMTMLTGQVYRALRDCDLDTNNIDALSMAQVSGIVLTANSASAGEECQRIEAIAMGDSE